MDRQSLQDTALSAEVEPFIPGRSQKFNIYHEDERYRQFSAHATQPPLAQMPQPPRAPMSQPPLAQMSQPPLTEIPRYMTSCYPFVAESSSNDPRWQTPGHPPFQSSYQPSMNTNSFQQIYPSTHPQQFPSAQQQQFTGQGQYQDHNQAYSRMDGREFANNYSRVNGTAPSFGQYANQCPPSGGSFHVANYPSNYNNLNYPSKPSPYVRSYHHNQTHYPAGQQRQVQQHQKNWYANAKSNAADWRKNMHGKVRQNAEPPNRPTKTLMMVDAALQTDFCPDIADKTLAELPSCLQNQQFITKRKSQGQQTGNDISVPIPKRVSTDMDNDGGYYSPKHIHASTSTTTRPTHGAGNNISGDKRSVFTSVQDEMFYTTYNNQQQIPQQPSIAPPPMQQVFHPKSPCQFNVPQDQGHMSYASVLTHKVAHYVHAQGARLANHSMPPSLNNCGVSKRSNTMVGVHPRESKSVSTSCKGETAHPKLKPHFNHSNVKLDSDNAVYGHHGLIPPQLHDPNEYPGLPGGTNNLDESKVAKHSYSAVVKKTTITNQPNNNMIESEDTIENELIQPGQIIQPETLMSPDVVASGIKDGKNARKRRKKAIQAAKAAAREYSEITLEQKQLHENLRKPNKRTKMPIEFDLGDMLAVLEKQQQDCRFKQEALAATKSISNARLQQNQVSEESKVSLNPLDTSLPKKRGKERETPVKKKPSALKKVILKEREEKKRQRALDENCLSDDGLANESSGELENMNTTETVLALSQDAVSERGSIMSGLTCSQSDLSPVSQMSPMSLSPLSPGSPLSSGLSSPATSMNINSPSHVASKIHSRRFREYCNQVLDKDIDACCTTLLQALVKFQDRQYHKDPAKAKAKRRIVMGLREVTKHLKIKKIKCIIVSPNLEKIQAKGGLDDALENISSLAQEQSVPLVFALGRKALGRAVNKLVPVSVVGLFNYDGAEETFQQLLQLSSQARKEYEDMIRKYQQDLEAANVARLTKHRHYMGHNRNLSGCSAISFSSVISEPISEDYPHPEPETDSRGNVLANHVNYEKVYEIRSNVERSNAERSSSKSTDSIQNAEDNKVATSKASSETLEPASGEKDDDTEIDNEERVAADELDETDVPDENEVPDENDIESDEETPTSEVTVPEESTSDTRVAHWVVEAQSCFENLSLKVADEENTMVVNPVAHEIATK